MTWDGKERRAGHRAVLPECLEVFKKLDEIHKAIVGNGHPGLKTDVAILQQKEIDRAKHWFAIYASIVTLFCGIIGQILWKVIKG